MIPFSIGCIFSTRPWQLAQYFRVIGNLCSIYYQWLVITLRIWTFQNARLIIAEKQISVFFGHFRIDTNYVRTKRGDYSINNFRMMVHGQRKYKRQGQWAIFASVPLSNLNIADDMKRNVNMTNFLHLLSIYPRVSKDNI